MNKIKERGEIYTPFNIVNLLLYMSGYYKDNILEKHVIDNSCGIGNILTEIVKRYCDVFLEKYNDLNLLKAHLETYIHGVEIDNNAHIQCIKNLNNIVKKYGLSNVKWDIECNDLLLIYDKYLGMIDYVIGNPPYVNVHNFNAQKDKIKTLNMCKEGMTDLYIAFYEIGIKMLSNVGKLCYITPNTFFHSKSGKVLRENLIKNNLLTTIFNFAHNKVFNVSTYTCICLLKKQNTTHSIEYFEGCFNSGCRKMCTYDSFYFDRFLFVEEYFLSTLTSILNTEITVVVKNGLATLNDKYFIRDDFGFSSKYIISVIKASKNKRQELFFPYSVDGKIISREELIKDENIKKILIDKYTFGRTQAIKDVFKNKIYVNNLILDKNSIKIGIAPSGTAVYSGFYILSDYSLKQISEALYNDVFIKYINIVGTHRSGGYVSYTSKDLSLYLSWYFKNFT